MKLRLDKAPIGLLELMNLKSNGAQLDEFDGTVQGSVDVFSFYGVDRNFTADTPQAAAAFPLNGTVNVSFPRAFIGFGAQVTVGAAAGTRLDIRIAYKSNPNAPSIVVVQQRFTPFVGGFFDAYWQSPFPLVLPPGGQWNVAAFSDAGGADHVLNLKSWSYDLNPSR